MRVWKKIALILLGILIVAQIPSIYLRFQKRDLAAKIADLESRNTSAANADYREYTGVVHVHTGLGEHSTGSFGELLAGAQISALDFVVLTEHSTPHYDTSAMTFRGFQSGVFFVAGNEMDTENQDRFLLLPGSSQAEEMTRESTEEFLGIMHSQNKLAIVAYPETYKTWDADFDGIEVFNMGTNLKKMNVPYFLFDALWSYGAYPELTLAGYLTRPDDNLRKFDETAQTRKITLVGGTDAHSNMGFHFFGDDNGKKFINFKLDSYKSAFGIVRQHIFLKNGEYLSDESILGALKDGRSFIGFDVLGATKGFSFTAQNGTEKEFMGGEIPLRGGVDLKSSSPLAARFVLLKDGEKVLESGGVAEINFTAKEKGAYRIEAYLDSLGDPFDKMPWIISNPIYLR